MLRLYCNFKVAMACLAVYIHFKSVSQYKRHYKDSLVLQLQSRIKNEMSEKG